MKGTVPRYWRRRNYYKVPKSQIEFKDVNTKKV
jgi:hypothetical protein